MIPSVMAEHMRVIEAIEQRDPDGAARALAEHIDVARSRAVKL
jgi:DNA-binding GntR family transcriptional regulator